MQLQLSPESHMSTQCSPSIHLLHLLMLCRVGRTGGPTNPFRLTFMPTGSVEFFNSPDLHVFVGGEDRGNPQNMQAQQRKADSNTVPSCCEVTMLPSPSETQTQEAVNQSLLKMFVFICVFVTYVNLGVEKFQTDENT